MARRRPPGPALLEIKSQVALRNVVFRPKSQKLVGAINGLRRSFQFDKGADGGLVQFDEQVTGPAGRRREAIRGAKFLVAEPPAHPQGLQNVGQRCWLCDLDLDLLADCVSPNGNELRCLPEGAGRQGVGGAFLQSRAFVGEDGAKKTARCLPRTTAVLAFDADTQELPLLGQGALRRVEEEIHFANARIRTSLFFPLPREQRNGGNGARVELLQAAPKCSQVSDTAFNFDFAVNWHDWEAFPRQVWSAARRFVSIAPRSRKAHGRLGPPADNRGPEHRTMTEPTTPLMRQYHAIKTRYPHALLLFRLGDFYELFYEDALVASRELQITLTARNRERGQPVPMCGVPYHAAETYIARLIRAGYKVAICDQMEQPVPGKKLVRREVVRVITPGTATDLQVLEPKENNFLAAVARDSGEGIIGLAYVDISTGEFSATEFAA